MKLIDNDLQLLPVMDPTTRIGWETVTGPSIAGKPNPPLPTATGWFDLAGGIREFFIQGPPDANVCYATHRPSTRTSGIVHLSARISTDMAAQTQMRCFELDSIVTVNKLKGNMSSQFNLNSGMFEIADPAGNWISTGLRVHRFAPYEWYQLDYDYWFDSVAKRCSLLSMSLNGQKFSPPVALQNVPMSVTNWADVMTLQVQLDLDVGSLVPATGGEFAVKVTGVDYIWDLS